VADIFFSYSRKDKERVGVVRNALSEMGFEVFWDQETSSGSDWDTWIRAELAKSKCAVVFWSATSTVSDNVRHEAVVAKEQRKLISVFLDQLPARDLPMGFYSQQAADLSKWNGDQEDTEWRKFRSEFEAKLMPRWVHQKLNRVDAELEGERARRETAEAREKTLRAQISKEAKVQQELKGDRDSALAEAAELKEVLQTQIAKQVESERRWKGERDITAAEVARLKATADDLARLRSDSEGHSIELSQRLSDLEMRHSESMSERDRALAEVEKLTATVEGLSRARPGAEPLHVQPRAIGARGRWHSLLLLSFHRIRKCLIGNAAILAYRQCFAQSRPQLIPLSR
jgi:TIR domain